MLEKGSAELMSIDAAAQQQGGGRSEWFAAWDTIGALARDAGALHEKCGGNCSVEDLREWRERVLSQLNQTLLEEQRYFEEICAHCGSTRPAGQAA
jgi:hypothetical protein